MTMRMFTGIAACCGAAVALICGTPHPVRSSLALAPERQKIDVLHAHTPQPHPLHPALNSTLSGTPHPEHSADELDALSAPFDLNLAQISALEHGESVQIRLPNERSIVLQPTAVAARNGTLITTALAESLVSTITRRGRQFYATIATPDASYRVIGRDGSATALSQRTLAARSAFIQEDFQHAR